MAQLLLRPPLSMIPSQLSVCSKGEQAAAIISSSTTSSSSCSCLTLRSSSINSGSRRRRCRSYGREWCGPATVAATAAEGKMDDEHEGEMDDVRMMQILSGEEKQEEEDAWKKKLSGRERRALKNRNRGERGRKNNWEEEEVGMDDDHLVISYVSGKLLAMDDNKKEKEEGKSFNLNSLSKLGPQWWTLNVDSRRREIAAQRLLQTFNRSYPHVPLKVHAPVIRLKRRLKNGSISVRTKAIYSTFLFIHCVLNREIHDFIRNSYGIGGFVGPRIKIPNFMEVTKPKPVPDMETVFEEERRRQEAADRDFDEQCRSSEESPDNDIKGDGAKNIKSAGSTRIRRSRKKSASSDRNPSGNGSHEPLLLGSDVRVLSGPFAGFVGRLKEMDHKNGKAMVIFMLFGEEAGCKFDVDQLEPVSSSTINS